MLTASGVFQIFESGTVTVLGFAQGSLPNHFYHEEIRDDLIQLLAAGDCRVIAFDLRDVPCFSSGMFGLLAWLTKRGVEVRLLHPMDHIRETLTALRLDHLLVAEPLAA